MNEQNASARTGTGRVFDNSFLRGRWETSILPTASILALPTDPGNFLNRDRRSATSGWPEVAAKFAVLFRGIAAALLNPCLRRTSELKGDAMKHALNSHSESQTLNRERARSVGVKEKPKTIYIKLHPKPYAPRHSAIQFQGQKLRRQ
jgi:hypothetical protein